MSHDALIEIIEREQWEGVKSPAYVALKNSLAARQPAEVQEPVGGLDWISVAIRDMCEIPYRDSPEGMPDMLVVSAEEIRDAIERRMPHPAPLPDTVSVPVGTFAQGMEAAARICEYMDDASYPNKKHFGNAYARAIRASAASRPFPNLIDMHNGTVPFIAT